jgi:LPS export ABC transporter protein LptC
MRSNLLCIILGVLSTILVVATSCSNKIEDIPDTSDEIYQKERAYNVTFIVSQDGLTKVSLYCNIFERFNDFRVNYVDFLDSVYVEFYNANQIIDNVLTAKRARYYPNTGDVVVNDSVRVITKDNDTMYTRKLLYSEKLQKIYTTDSVRIQNGPQVTTGAYLEANKDFTWVRIYNQKGVIPVNDEDMNIAD